MIANYGYVDGSGEYYIAIDTGCCETCQEHGCLTACPHGLFEIVTDDYDEEVAAVKAALRNTLKYTCADCKPVHRTAPLPCVEACAAGGIRHTW